MKWENWWNREAATEIVLWKNNAMFANGILIWLLIMSTQLILEN